MGGKHCVILKRKKIVVIFSYSKQTPIMLCIARRRQVAANSVYAYRDVLNSLRVVETWISRPLDFTDGFHRYFNKTLHKYTQVLYYIRYNDNIILSLCIETAMTAEFSIISSFFVKVIIHYTHYIQ